MKKRKVYISGPISGIDRSEYMQRFAAAQHRLHLHAFKRVCNPTRVWACRWPKFYKLLERLFGKQGAYYLVLLYDLWLMLRCTDILMLNNYQNSRGACIERYVATKFGLNFIKGVNV